VTTNIFRWGTILSHYVLLPLSRTVPGSIPGSAIGFFTDMFLRSFHGPAVDSAPSENE